MRQGGPGGTASEAHERCGPRSDPWEAAITLLARRAHSAEELRQGLVRRGYAADQIAAVVARLKSCRYLDDLEFARSWVRSRAQRRAIGPARVRQELHARGVGESEIGAVLEELLAGEDIRNLAEGAVRRKLESLRGLAPDIARRRLAAFLDRRGFDGGTILEMCRRHFPRDEDDQ